MGKKGKKARRQGLASSQPPPPSSEPEVDYKPKNPFDYIDVDDACTKFAKMSVGGDTACFICLEGHREGQPLLRDCSCRGSSGWAHFDCLIKYAEQKSDTLLKKGSYTPDEMKNIWGLCYNCKQDFQDDLCVGMAAGYVCFIENQPLYPRKDWDVLESLKYMQRTHSAHNHAQNINVEEGKLVSRRILSLLEKYNASNYSGPRIHPQRLLELEADTYRVLGSFCFCEKDYDDVIEYNEKAIALYKELSEKFDERKYTIMIADSQNFIQSASKMTKSPEGENKCTDHELEQQKVMYDTAMKEEGEITAIYPGLNYSDAHSDQATELRLNDLQENFSWSVKECTAPIILSPKELPDMSYMNDTMGWCSMINIMHS